MRKKCSSKEIKGITLIALVITIIVLLILAGVTIAAISGNEGTANKAQEARNKTEIANAKEQVKLLSAGYIQEFYERKYVKNESVAQANKGEYILYKLNEIGTYGNYQFQVDAENKTLAVYTAEGKALIEGKVNDNGTIEWNEETTGGDIPPVGPVEPVVVNPTSIAITNKSSLTEIDINGTVELEATVEPEEASGTITWNCDIEGTVEFSEATGTTTTITGKTAGKVKITATIGSLTSNEIEITIKEPIVEITATFDPNGGGTPSQTTITKNVGEALGTLPTVSRTNYNFDGWYTEASGGIQISSETKMPGTAPTYYAHWSLETSTITFNANGGTGTMAAATVAKTTTINTLSNSFTAPTGYTFDGWASSETSHTALTEKATNDRTVYAIWKCSGTGLRCTSGSTSSCNGTYDYARTSVKYCSSCKKEYSSTGSHTVSGYKCQYCKIESLTQSVVHNYTKWARYKCPECGWLGDYRYASDYSGSYPATRDWSGTHTNCSGAKKCEFVTELSMRCAGSNSSTVGMGSATITCPGTASSTWKCTKCGNYASVCYHSPCSHGNYSSHTVYNYCSHNKTSAHDYCSHNNTSTHYYK